MFCCFFSGNPVLKMKQIFNQKIGNFVNPWTTKPKCIVKQNFTSQIENI